MKKVLFILLIFNSLFGIAQDKRFGIILSFNNCSHTNFNPQIPEDGQTQWNVLNTNGIGIFYNFDLNRKFELSIECSFNKRGYREEAQTGYLFGPTDYNTLQNSFKYLSLSNSLTYSVFQRKKISISPKIGIELNYLLDTKIESEKIAVIANNYPVSEFKDNWKKLNLNGTIGINFLIADKIAFEPGFNRSLTPLLKTENLVVKDWIWSLKLYFHLNKIF